MAGLRWLLHPALVLAAVFGCAALMGHAPQFISVAVPIIGAALVILWLERTLPFRGEWVASPGSFGQDAAHNLLSTMATSAATRALAFAALFEVAAALQQLAGGSLWPHHWPMLLQFTLAVVVKEFFSYSTHRWLHATRFGWRLHTLHHSAERLHSMTSGRTHPLNVFLTYGIPLIPLVVVGASDDVLASVAVFMAVHGLLQHSNIDLRYGWLSWVFATAEIHRGHHSRDLALSSANFGHNLLVWDHVFGTFRPPERTRTIEVGVTGPAQPATFWQQLAAPFRHR